MNLTLNNLEATEKFANVLAEVCEPPLIIFLEGDLGVGKTTLVRAFLRAKGYEGKVKSPTYTLIETYELADQTVVHVDLYRITDPDEIEYLALREQFTATSITFIEWPHLAELFGIESNLNLSLRTTQEDARELTLNGDKNHLIFKKLCAL